MISIAELKRRLGNMVQVGTVSETKNKEGKALARVIVDDDGDNTRVTAFLPVVGLVNSFVKVWFPLRVKEQVLVISPFGNANSGFIIRSIFNRSCKEPAGANEHTAILEFEDGTRISYDSESNDLKVDASKSINIICQTAKVVANSTTFESDVVIKGKLSVTETISGKDGGVASFDCDIETKNIKSSGTIEDGRGDLTNHTNNGNSRD